MSVFIGYPSFMAYQMMKGKKGNNDGFPSVPGMIARYSALGLTNEQMAANPVWVDKTGNGHDLQMKNFLWDGMSGVGGYETNAEIYEFSPTSTNKIVADRVKHISFTFEVKGMVSGNDLSLRDGLNTIYYSWKKDGIYTVDIDVLDPAGTLRLYNGYSHQKGTFTVRIFPSYPGALVFDGVDDYGICDNFPILTKEKGYTVVALRQWDQDFLNTTLTGGLLSTRNYSTGEGVAFEKIESSNKGYWNLGAGGIIDFAKSPFTWQTSKQYNNVGILKGGKNHGKPLCVGCGLSGGQQCGRFAIWELVFLDHDATEEELTKIKDYFIKTYPWLFPDQAWTVTGKTNEDADRATIANITGNGNNLVLSNFGFAEGSGYGLYAYNFNSFSLKDNTVKPTDVKKDSFRIIGTGDRGNVSVLSNVSNSADWKIRITGMKDGDHLLAGNANKSGDYVKITKDGVYTFQKQYAANATNGIWYNSSQEVDVLVEQIPEYEGYLVTDGVDDKITSSDFKMGKDFTVVGEWVLLQNINTSSLRKNGSFVIRNHEEGLSMTINRTSPYIRVHDKSLKAFCSNGAIYKSDWTEQIDTSPQSSTGGSSQLMIAGHERTMEHDKIAFKNLAIYPTVLSKDDCIKAYNYLQTLKAK